MVLQTDLKRIESKNKKKKRGNTKHTHTRKLLEDRPAVP